MIKYILSIILMIGSFAYGQQKISADLIEVDTNGTTYTSTVLQDLISNNELAGPGDNMGNHVAQSNIVIGSHSIVFTGNDAVDISNGLIKLHRNYALSNTDIIVTNGGVWGLNEANGTYYRLTEDRVYMGEYYRWTNATIQKAIYWNPDIDGGTWFIGDENSVEDYYKAVGSTNDNPWDLTWEKAFNGIDPVPQVLAQDRSITTEDVVTTASTNQTLAGDWTFGRVKFASEVWDDLRIEPNVRGSGANNPVFDTVTNGLKIYRFSATSMNEMYFTVQFPHGIKRDSIINPHVHYITKIPATNGVVWNWEYTYAGVDEEFPASTTLSVTNEGSTLLHKHMIKGFGDVDVNVKESGVMIGRLYRDPTHPSDYADEVGLLYIDIHYQVEKLGTPAELPDP